MKHIKLLSLPMDVKTVPSSAQLTPVGFFNLLTAIAEFALTVLTILGKTSENGSHNGEDPHDH